MELKLIPAQTGNGTMKMYTNPKSFLSVDSWPPKSKDMQLLILRSCMSFLSGGQPKQEMELKLIPAKTRNRTMKMYTSIERILSVDHWPRKRKDMQLIIDFDHFNCFEYYDSCLTQLTVMLGWVELWLSWGFDISWHWAVPSSDQLV